jgi:hypothetical protein
MGPEKGKWRILICGSRDWPYRSHVFNRVEKLHAELRGNLLIIAGGAAGPDSWAVEAAKRLDIETIVVQPTWRRPNGSLNTEAGRERNIQMLDMRPDFVIAFWYNESGGTAHTIRNAQIRDIRTEINTLEE